VFDSDGTLWAEQPLSFQLAFAIDRARALAPRHPDYKTRETFASVLRGDLGRLPRKARRAQPRWWRPRTPA
jgi:hypothetical protein